MAKRTGFGRRGLVAAAIVISGWLTATTVSAAQRGSEDKDSTTRLQFIVTIEGVGVGYFTEVSGLSAEVEVIEYLDGADGSIRKLPGRTKYPNLILKRGFVPGGALWQWFQKVAGGVHDTRDITIAILDRRDEPIATFSFQNAFPVKWHGPELDASGNDPTIETIEIAHEGFSLE